MSKNWENEALEMAYVIIANAGGGNWDNESKDWCIAACKWREEYLSYLQNERIKRESRLPKELLNKQKTYGCPTGVYGPQGVQGCI